MSDDVDLTSLATRVKNLEDTIRRLQTAGGGSVWPIASSVAGVGGVASFDFTSIPAGFYALKLLASLRSTKAAVNLDTVLSQFNAVATANYYLEGLYGSAATPASFEALASSSVGIGTATAAGSPASDFAAIELTVYDYANANKKPMFICQGFSFRNTTTGLSVVELRGGTLNVAGAVNEIKLYNAADSWAQYSSAKLYGVM